MVKDRERCWSAMMMAELGHELRNVLCATETLVTVLRQELPASSSAAEILDDLLVTSERAARLSHRVTELARGMLSDTPADLVAVVARQASALRRIAPRDVTVHVGVCPGPVATCLSVFEVEQVVYNLAHNAFHSMPSGGALAIEVTAAEGTAALVVRDTGTGMDAPTLERCFDPFFSTKGERGTGIGLHAVRNAVEAAGGRIELTSTPGRGTTVAIYLPIRTGAPAA